MGHFPTTPSILLFESHINIESDVPYALALSALEAIPVLTGTQDTGFNFSIYTGDLVSHDPDNELSREYVMYTEVCFYTCLS